MKQKLLLGLLSGLLVVNALVGFRLYADNVSAAGKDDPYESLHLFTTVLERIRQEYVDGEELSYQELVSGALAGMLAKLDPHSEFMEPTKYEDLRKDTEGRYGGIGVVVSLKEGRITVVSPMEGSPGFNAGIRAGDVITGIDGQSTDELDLPDAVQLLRGKPGSKVAITLDRVGASEPMEVVVAREVIRVGTVKDVDGNTEFPLAPDGVGYVRILQFGEQTATDLGDALSKLEKQGMKSLVLDLRDNPGGLLDQAVLVADQFLPAGELIVYTKGRGDIRREEYRSVGSGRDRDYPMVVLINGGSASASEIVAGCLQDLGRAYLIGEQTFGKGSVQSILPLKDGAALRLTTARYFTPSHRVIHAKGITPDSIVSISREQERLLMIKGTPGSMDTLSPEEQEEVRNAVDPQLLRARETLRGIELFSEIAPNRTIPAGPSREPRREIARSDAN